MSPVVADAHAPCFRGSPHKAYLFQSFAVYVLLRRPFFKHETWHRCVQDPEATIFRQLRKANTSEQLQAMQSLSHVRCRTWDLAG